MVDSAAAASMKQNVLTASGLLKKAALLSSLLEQTLSHIQSLLDTVVERTKKIIKRLDFLNDQSSIESALKSHSQVLG